MKRFARKLSGTKIIALDTNCFIYQFAKHLKYSRYTNHIFTLLDENKIKIITSIISLIEVNSHSGLRKNTNLLALYQDFFTKTKNLRTFPVDTPIGILSAKIRREYGFATPDAIQIATAYVKKANLFITNDSKLKKQKLIPTLVLKDF